MVGGGEGLLPVLGSVEGHIKGAGAGLAVALPLVSCSWRVVGVYLQQTVPEFVIIIIINPLTTRVVGAPQMILQPVFSIFPCSPGPCPFPGVVFPPLSLSALSSPPFRCALQDGFGQT